MCFTDTFPCLLMSQQGENRRSSSTGSHFPKFRKLDSDAQDLKPFLTPWSRALMPPSWGGKSEPSITAMFPTVGIHLTRSAFVFSFFCRTNTLISRRSFWPPFWYPGGSHILRQSRIFSLRAKCWVPKVVNSTHW